MLIVTHNHLPGQPCNATSCPVSAYTSKRRDRVPFEERWPGRFPGGSGGPGRVTLVRWDGARFDFGTTEEDPSAAIRAAVDAAIRAHPGTDSSDWVIDRLEAPPPPDRNERLPGRIGDALEPQARAAVDAVAAGHADILVMQVVGFQTDAEALALRDLLWYAHKCGVAVQFAPKVAPKVSDA